MEAIANAMEVDSALLRSSIREHLFADDGSVRCEIGTMKDGGMCLRSPSYAVIPEDQHGAHFAEAAALHTPVGVRSDDDDDYLWFPRESRTTALQTSEDRGRPQQQQHDPEGYTLFAGCRRHGT